MIELQREGALFVLRLRGGENRIASVFLDEFERSLDHVEGAEGDAALVTVGTGRFYSNGLDLEALAGPERERAGEILGRLHGLLGRILGFPRPTVAALNGHAFAAGAMLAFAHDFRVMRADRGYLCLPEIDLATGRPLTPEMVALLQARLDARTLHEAIVTGRRYTAEEARARRLVDEVASEGEVLPRALEIARSLAPKDSATLGALKRGLYAAALERLEGSPPDPDRTPRRARSRSTP